MNDFFALYLIIGLTITALSLFSKETIQMLAERSLPWRFLWAALVTVFWFPALIIVLISRVYDIIKEIRK